jgi:hypothetical protein
LVNSYRRFRSFDNQEASDSIEFDEYEKSLYLTKAQEELVLSLYNGKNPYGDSYESTEEMRRYLDSLVKSEGLYAIIPLEISEIHRLRTDSVFFELPKECWFIVFEEVRLKDTIDNCKAGTLMDVVPVRHDDYHRIKKNPFRGPNERRALRLDAKGRVVEIICNYPIEKYFIRYIERPKPIILEKLPNSLTIGKTTEFNGGGPSDCELHEALHQRILELAVMMGLRSKGYQYRREKEE